jgi:hypothetical protein
MGESLMALSQAVQRWLIWAGVVSLIIALRLACVLYDRSRPAPVRPVVRKPIEQDHLVVVPSFHIEDFESAREVVGRQLWVKLGYVTEYFPVTRFDQPTDSSTSPQVFPPIAKFTVEKVAEKPLGGRGKDKELWLIFRKDDRTYATVAGLYDSENSRYRMRFDELFYPKDPRELYSHWGIEAWQKIERHELEGQMTFNQVILSLGYGGLVTTEAGGSQLYQFGRKPGGEPGKTRVRFLEGRVKEFEVLN